MIYLIVEIGAARLVNKSYQGLLHKNKKVQWSKSKYSNNNNYNKNKITNLILIYFRPQFQCQGSHNH